MKSQLQKWIFIENRYVDDTAIIGDSLENQNRKNWTIFGRPAEKKLGWSRESYWQNIKVERELRTLT